MRYRATFEGRRVNAIGITYPFEAICEGENEEQARENLYERYEHITKLKLVPMRDDEKASNPQ